MASSSQREDREGSPNKKTKPLVELCEETGTDVEVIKFLLYSPDPEKQMSGVLSLHEQLDAKPGLHHLQTLIAANVVSKLVQFLYMDSNPPLQVTKLIIKCRLQM